MVDGVLWSIAAAEMSASDRQSKELMELQWGRSIDAAEMRHH
jgi:hypothetical protein